MKAVDRVGRQRPGAGNSVPRAAGVQSTVTILVIGYGNTLRGDDGVGYRAAEVVESWHLENVRSLPCHQLTPELIDDIFHSQIVIFVDALASLSAGDTDVKVEQIRPDMEVSLVGHFADPRSLLALCQELYQATPIAYQVLIPAIDFAFSEDLSPVTQNYLIIALEKIQKIIGVSENFCEY